MPQLTNLAFFRARPGQTEALGAALVAPTRGEAGYLNYDLHQSLENAEIWFVYAGSGLAHEVRAFACLSDRSADPCRGRHRPSSIHHDFDTRNALTPIF